MNTTHSIVGTLISADLTVRHGMPTLTLLISQCAPGYSSQRISAERCYASTPAGTQLASQHHAALRIGTVYRVAAQALGWCDSLSLMAALGVQRIHAVDQWPCAVAGGQHEPNSLAAEGACRPTAPVAQLARAAL